MIEVGAGGGGSNNNKDIFSRWHDLFCFQFEDILYTKSEKKYKKNKKDQKKTKDMIFFYFLFTFEDIFLIKPAQKRDFLRKNKNYKKDKEHRGSPPPPPGCSRIITKCFAVLPIQLWQNYGKTMAKSLRILD